MPSLSLRLILFGAGLGFVSLVSVLAYVSWSIQSDIADIATGIYDNSYSGMSAAREAQTQFVRFMAARQDGAAGSADSAMQNQLAVIEDYLDIAFERAMTPTTKESAGLIRNRLSDLGNPAAEAISLRACQETTASHNLFAGAIV